MRRSLILIVIGILLFSQIQFLHLARSASEAPAVEWSKTYGGAKVGSEQAVVQTIDGGYAIASTADFGAGWVFWLTKTDSTGNAQWNKTYGESAPSVVCSLVQTGDGGYAIGGNTNGVVQNAWLVKTDSNGNMQLNKSYTELGWAGAYALIQTSDGGYVVSGVGFREDYDGWLMKTDANGTMQWSRSFVEVRNNQFCSVAQTSDGGYIAAGALTQGYKVNAYVVKTDSDGNTTWSKEFSRTSGSDYARSIVQAVDGGYAIVGDTDNFGNADFWLVKIDASGNLLWDKTYGGTGWDCAKSIVQTTDGGYVLAGQTSSFGAGSNDFWLVKTDAEGNMLWNQTYGGAGDDGIGALVYDVGSSVVQTRDGGFALCGYSNSFSGDGSYEVWLIKLRGSGPKTWIVDDDGPADFSTIQEAINAAIDGDTVFVKNGTYSEHLIINRTLQLVGEDRNATIVDNEYKDPPEMVGSVVIVAADNVKMSGFTIQHCRGGGMQYA